MQTARTHVWITELDARSHGQEIHEQKLDGDDARDHQRVEIRIAGWETISKDAKQTAETT